MKTELPLPASLTWGVSFRPVPKWEFAVDLQYVLWSAYDQLDVQILNPSTNLPVLTIPASDKTTPTRWHSASAANTTHSTG